MTFGELLNDPVYDLLGVEATVQPITSAADATLTVLDKTSGIEVGSHNQAGTIMPAATVRMSDVLAAGLTRGDLTRAVISFNGGVWVIDDTTPKPSPHGENDGELYLWLRGN